MARTDKELDRAYRRAWAKENPERTLAYARKHYLKKKYGITLEEFDALLEAQGGVCAICDGGPRPWPNLVVDHDHSTGRIRGLLCHPCNAGLGQFNDNPERLARALEYMGHIC